MFPLWLCGLRSISRDFKWLIYLFFVMVCTSHSGLVLEDFLSCPEVDRTMLYTVLFSRILLLIRQKETLRSLTALQTPGVVVKLQRIPLEENLRMSLMKQRFPMRGEAGIDALGGVTNHVTMSSAEDTPGQSLFRQDRAGLSFPVPLEPSPGGHLRPQNSHTATITRVPLRTVGAGVSGHLSWRCPSSHVTSAKPSGSHLLK